MPGMLRPEELDAARRAEPAAFDALFVRLMSFHHAGAIEMSDEAIHQAGDVRLKLMALFLPLFSLTRVPQAGTGCGDAGTHGKGDCRAPSPAGRQLRAVARVLAEAGEEGVHPGADGREPLVTEHELDLAALAVADAVGC